MLKKLRACGSKTLTHIFLIAGLVTIICCAGGSGGGSTTSTTSTTSGSPSDEGSLKVAFTWPTSDPSSVLNFCEKVRVLCVDSGGITRERVLSRSDGSSATFSALPVGTYRATIQGHRTSTSEPFLAGATHLSPVTKDNTTQVNLSPVSAVTQIQVLSNGNLISGSVQVGFGSSIPVTLVARNSTGVALPLPLAAFTFTSSSNGIADPSNKTQIKGMGIGSASLQASTTFASAMTSFSVSVPGAGGSVIIK